MKFAEQIEIISTNLIDEAIKDDSERTVEEVADQKQQIETMKNAQFSESTILTMIEKAAKEGRRTTSINVYMVQDKLQAFWYNDIIHHINEILYKNGFTLAQVTTSFSQVTFAGNSLPHDVCDVVVEW